MTSRWLRLLLLVALVAMFASMGARAQEDEDVEGFDDEDEFAEEFEEEVVDGPNGGEGGGQRGPEMSQEQRMELQQRTVVKLTQSLSPQCLPYLQQLVDNVEDRQPNEECDTELREKAPMAQREAIEDMQNGVPMEELKFDGGAGKAASAEKHAFGRDHAIVLATVVTLLVGTGFWLSRKYMVDAQYRKEHADEIAREEEAEKKRREKKERQARKQGKSLEELEEEEDKGPNVRKERTQGPNMPKKKKRALKTKGGS